MQKLIEALKATGRFILFRSSSSELNALGPYHLAIGLVFVWLAGVGRHWDDEGAGFLQSAGVGSLIYVFFLAGYLWLMLWPLRPRNWSYFQVLTAICLTAAPALLYAIPIERWLELETSQIANLWALGIVALWRVALFIFFLVRSGRLIWWRSAAGTLFVMSIIVCVLGFFAIAASIADGMAGTRAPKSDPIKEFTLAALMLGSYSFVPLLFANLYAIFRPTYTPPNEPERNPDD